MFYKDKLETIASSKWQVLEPLQMWNNPENPCVFCHVEGEEEYLSYSTDEGNEMSRYNMAEVHQVVSTCFCNKAVEFKVCRQNCIANVIGGLLDFLIIFFLLSYTIHLTFFLCCYVSFAFDTG